MRCFVDKHFHGHTLFEDIDPEFVVDAPNLWDPHPILTTAMPITKEKYHVIAESKRGPLVAYHQNCCVTQFTISRKYRESVQFLSNFLGQKILDISYSHIVHLSLKEAVEKRRTHVVMDERVEKAQEEAGNLCKISEKVKKLKG